MKTTVDMIITDILRQMFADCTLDDKGKERLYKKIFNSIQDGDIYEEKRADETDKECHRR